MDVVTQEVKLTISYICTLRVHHLCI